MVGRLQIGWFATVLGLSLALTHSARGAWEPPKDNLLTEKQVTSYIDIMRQLLAELKATDKAVQGKSGLEAAAMINRAGARFKQIVADHGMTEPEFEWVKERTFEAWGGIMREGVFAQMKEQGQQQAKS